MQNIMQALMQNNPQAGAKPPMGPPRPTGPSGPVVHNAPPPVYGGSNIPPQFQQGQGMPLQGNPLRPAGGGRPMQGGGMPMQGGGRQIQRF